MTHDELLDEIGNALRVVIVGGPRTGKSTLADRIAAKYLQRPEQERQAMPGLSLLRTDDLIQTHDWSEVSAIAADWLETPGAFVIEGVATARALRKWLAQNPGTPLNAVIVLTAKPFDELTKEQSAMDKGVSTVWNKIVIDLLKRGAKVINAASPKPIRKGGQSSPATAAE